MPSIHPFWNPCTIAFITVKMLLGLVPHLWAICWVVGEVHLAIDLNLMKTLAYFGPGGATQEMEDQGVQKNGSMNFRHFFWTAMLPKLVFFRKTTLQQLNRHSLSHRQILFPTSSPRLDLTESSPQDPCPAVGAGTFDSSARQTLLWSELFCSLSWFLS